MSTDPSLLNWITDFNIHLTAEGVTDGFLAGFEAVRLTIEQLVTQTRGGFFLAGHSLGGALSVVAAKSLVERNVVAADRIRGVYTIGMPRPGNESYARTYDDAAGSNLGKKTFRLIHGDDVVPRIPPSSPPFNFRHVGAALSCRRGGTFSGVPVAQDEVAQDKEIAADLDVAFKADQIGQARLPGFPAEYPVVAGIVATLPPLIRDHLPDRYLAALDVLPAA